MAHHQGMSLLVAGLPAARPADAAALRGGPAVPGDRCCCCRSASRRRRRIHPHAAEVVGGRAAPRRRRRRRCASSRTPDTPAPGGAAAVERPLPRHGHQRRRRLQPLAATWRSRAGARTRPATAGARSATCATSTAASSGRPRTSRRCKRADSYEAIFSEGRAEFRRRDGDYRHARRDRRLARGRRRAAPRRASPTARARARTIELTSYAEVVLAPARRRRAAPGLQQPVRADRDRAATRQAILCTRRPRSRRRAAAVDVPPDGGARRRSRRRLSYETDRARFIGRGRTRRATRRRMHRRGAAVRQPRARCSIRSSRSAAAIALEPDADGDASTWSPASARRARRRSRWSRSTATATSPTACSSWPGRTARSCCASSTRPRPTRSSTGGWPARSSTPTRRCAPTPAVIARNRRGQSGLWGYAHLRRPADRAAADRRRRQHRARAPAGAGARLLAPEGAGGRPRDLERGPRRLPAGAAGADHGPDRRRRRGAT